jgi:calcineurin-like phosphoesterase family protein
MDYFLATDEQYVPEECESCNDCETYKDKEE